MKKEKTTYKIYNLTLHEKLRVSSTTDVIRVAGGWLYETVLDSCHDEYVIATVFVPFNNEYQETSPVDNRVSVCKRSDVGMYNK